ncbi:uncharacterized protein MONOS_6521 [Monocercomonoides exilis]|uniref:uncharacterized protein n=1 Tax=Monocercomonoides exilis TaxID=2049356 RepID=UPI00355A25CB|nr:hypothetical protein MONOS_6521 [Monocercomonoides exilis]|eukprot:MONOS_6521.1-p1 / transcript=MONOS_6521.1 / gene=MONOS_6521 / organism=Monocercomonoides_exilis_PA203 / gene_product=unspecified product / transcript_product=unspecified product / location=Mono_scaffold00206:74895-76196(-) / protein_length=434 / sequence_SO=supercontig / SO=protein_coding / is_pseudo=false
MMNITGCTFTRCMSLQESSYAREGGAIYASSDSRIKNSIFNCCHSIGDGGGICATMEISLSNNTFTACSSISNGGGLYIKSISSTMNSKNLTFSHCISGLFGGGVSFYSRDIAYSFESIIFSNCQAGLSGGGVYIFASRRDVPSTRIIFKDCQFSNNEAKKFDPQGSTPPQTNYLIGDGASHIGGTVETLDAVTCNSFIRCTATKSKTAMVFGDQLIPFEWISGKCVMTQRETTIFLVVFFTVAGVSTLIASLICFCVCRRNKKLKREIEKKKLALEHPGTAEQLGTIQTTPNENAQLPAGYQAPVIYPLSTLHLVPAQFVIPNQVPYQLPNTGLNASQTANSLNVPYQAFPVSEQIEPSQGTQDLLQMQQQNYTPSIQIQQQNYSQTTQMQQQTYTPNAQMQQQNYSPSAQMPLIAPESSNEVMLPSEIKDM